MARRRYQKGRVFLRGSKKRVWVGRWREDLVFTDGTVRRVERSTILGDERELKTKRLAQRRLDLTLARINDPDYRPGRVASIAEFAEKWQAEILIHRKPSTVKAAKSHLKIYILPQLGRMQLDELGRELQQAFATRVVTKVSRKTVVNILGTLSTMLTTAKAWGYITESVKLGTLALPESPLRSGARFFSGEEAKKIIEAAGDPSHNVRRCGDDGSSGWRDSRSDAGGHRFRSKGSSRSALCILRTHSDREEQIQSGPASYAGCSNRDAAPVPNGMASESGQTSLFKPARTSVQREQGRAEGTVANP
jgi:hypothetical protein